MIPFPYSDGRRGRIDAGQGCRTHRGTEQRAFVHRSVVVAFLLLGLMAIGAPVIADEPSLSCEGAPPVCASWLEFAHYLEKLEQGGWSEAEIAYVEDAVREREDDLHDLGQTFQRSKVAEEKTLGTNLKALYTEISKKAGRDLVDLLDDGKLDDLIATLESVDAHCKPPEAEEGSEG